MEDIVASSQALSHNSPIPESIYQALFHFDSRATSLLLKDLSKAGLGYRAVEIFEWLRALDASHPLRHLCDVYTYTAMISLCIYDQVLPHHRHCRSMHRIGQPMQKIPRALGILISLQSYPADFPWHQGSAM